MVTTYRNYVLLYSLKNVVKEVATCVFYLWKEKTIALHPGISKQDVVFHTSTQEKKKKTRQTKLFKRLQSVRYL